MSDIHEEISKVNAKIAELLQVKEEAEKSARAHEQAARDDRLRMDAAKQEISQYQRILHDAKVQSAVQQSASDAAKAKQGAEAARSEQEAVLAELKQAKEEMAAKLSELNAALEKAKAADTGEQVG